jgi:hypothetical protein
LTGVIGNRPSDRVSGKIAGRNKGRGVTSAQDEQIARAGLDGLNSYKNRRNRLLPTCFLLQRKKPCRLWNFSRAAIACSL